LIAKIIKLPVEKVRYESNLFTELNVDSLLGVEIFAALDKKYGVNIPEDKLRNIATLNDLIALVEKQLANK
jgi:acyl carrier protein